MPRFEKIAADKIDGLIKALIKNRTLVKVAVPDSDYGQLTVVTDAKNESGNAYFQIDPPIGLRDALAGNSCRTLIFEFSNEDKLPHQFEAAFKELDADLWLLYPDYIKRYQLRDNFRIKAPANAKATFLIEDTRITSIIDNISLGGIFCHCPNAHKELISVGSKSSALSMTFTFGGERHVVTIDRAIVRRIEGGTFAKHFGVAFEFLHIKADARKRLTRIVYDMQRDYLKNRSRNGP